MQKTISQLWNGQLAPIKCFGKSNAEMQELTQLMQRILVKVENKLCQQDLEIFQKYSDCIDEYITVACEQAFCDGYSLGTTITVEALRGTEENG